MPVDGGYRVNGKWGFASGSFYATWFTGGVNVVDDSGRVTGIGMVLAPRSDFSIEDTWFVAGMNGTASNTVVLEDVFVPTDHLTPLGEEAPGGSDPADRWPLGSALSVVLTGPLLGAAQACADLVTEKAPTRALSYTSYAATTDSMVALAEIARARLDVDTGCHARPPGGRLHRRGGPWCASRSPRGGAPARAVRLSAGLAPPGRGHAPQRRWRRIVRLGQRPAAALAGPERRKSSRLPRHEHLPGDVRARPLRSRPVVVMV